MDNETLTAVGLYAGLNMLIIFWLANETGKLRRQHKIAVGDGGNKHLARIMRGSANAAEYVPLFLIMLGIAALTGMPAWAVHAIGFIYTAGRALHAWYFIQPKGPLWQRLAGFFPGALATLGLALWLIAQGLMALFSG